MWEKKGGIFSNTASRNSCSCHLHGSICLMLLVVVVSGMPLSINPLEV